MSKPVIHSIQVINGPKYATGLNCESIKDGSVEWPSSIDFIFRVYGENEELLAEVINCPVVVEYDSPGRKKVPPLAPWILPTTNM